jgi:hypothetical protein
MHGRVGDAPMPKAIRVVSPSALTHVLLLQPGADPRTGLFFLHLKPPVERPLLSTPIRRA